MLRLDKELVVRQIVQTRSQAESYIKLGLVKVNNKAVTKPGFLVSNADDIKLASEQYVSRAALKLSSISKKFNLQFSGKTVLDVGSSTGGFTQFALRGGAKKVIAVDVGTNQLHPSLQGNPKIELHEKTDIREFQTKESVDLVLADVSFISLRYILPHVKTIIGAKTQLVAMCKPQFEAGKGQVNKGVIKNSAIRRQILKDFETWLGNSGFVVLNKADSQVAGDKGNLERFYLLKISNR